MQGQNNLLRPTLALTMILAIFASSFTFGQTSKNKLEEEKIPPVNAKQHQIEFANNLKTAIAYLSENKKIASQYINAQELKEARSALSKDDLESYINNMSAKQAHQNKEAKFILQPTIFNLADLGSTLNNAKNYQQVKKSYLALAGSVDKKIRLKVEKAFTKFKRLDDKLYAVIWGIFRDIPNFVDRGNNKVTDTSKMNCSLELGYSSTKNDGAMACLPPGVPTGSDGRNFSSTGLLGTRAIPLEPHLTCSKDQKRRGTCVGFAITANLETRASVVRSKKYNFSEQYNYFKSEIYSGNGRYSYGLSTQPTTNDWANDNWATGRETTWTYNRGLSMDDLETNSIFTYQDNVYPDSCDGYSEFCTDFAFQGQPTNNHTTFTRPSPQSSTDNLEARVASNITWGIFKSAKNTLMNEVVPLLNAKIPVIVSFGVTDGYMGGGSGAGYITWSSSDPSKSGGHANLLVGYVSKNDLPAGVPVPQGSGYFISKNSWGANRGDCGYDYLDEKWLRKKMTSLTTLTVN